MTYRIMDYDEWAASGGGIYASYDDYRRGVHAINETQKELEQDQLAEKIARKVVAQMKEKAT